MIDVRDNFVLFQVTYTEGEKICVFINISESNIKAQENVWSSRGCELVTSQTSRTTTTCACNHMTLFAVLMDSGGNKVITKLVRIPQIS